MELDDSVEVDSDSNSRYIPTLYSTYTTPKRKSLWGMEHSWPYPPINLNFTDPTEEQWAFYESRGLLRMAKVKTD